MSFYAHSLENQPPEDWETMAQHEQAVATRCAQFLKRIHPDLEAWGDLLGRWHDLGKYSSDFQNYILSANKILDQVFDRHQDGGQSQSGLNWWLNSCSSVGRVDRDLHSNENTSH